MSRFVAGLKKVGLALGIVVFIAWLCVWGWLSGFFQNSYDTAQERVFQITVDAGLYVEDLLVEGRENADAALIMAILNVEKGGPILAFDPDSARQSLEKIAWIKSARVERRLPNQIYVHLTERKPMALWKKYGDDNRIRLVDDSFYVLSSAPHSKFKDYVMVTGEGAEGSATKLLRLISAEPEIKPYVDRIDFINGRRWDIVMSRGMVVKMPENDTELALRKLASMHAESGLLDRDLQAIDMRDHNKVTVRTKPGHAEDYRTKYNDTDNSKTDKGNQI